MLLYMQNLCDLMKSYFVYIQLRALELFFCVLLAVLYSVYNCDGLMASAAVKVNGVNSSREWMWNASVLSFPTI